MRRPRRLPHFLQRRGYGTLLVLVLAILLVLAVVGIGHGFFSSSVSDLTLAVTRGDVALDLAADALCEAHFWIAQSVNDPQSPLYQQFRTSTTAFSFDIPLASLTALSQELDNHPHLELVGGVVQAQTAPTGPLSRANPTEHERMHALRISASIRHRTVGLTRRLAYSYDYKVHLTTLPRPLDTQTLFVADARPLVTTFADANESIKNSVARLAALLDLLKKTREQFDKLKKEAQGQAGTDKLDTAIKECQKLEKTWPTITVGTGASNSTTSEVRLFPAGPFAITTEGAQIDLAAINLPVKVRSRASAIATKEKEQGDAYKAWADNFNTLAQSNPAELLKRFQTWLTKLSAVANEYKGLLIDDYQTFQNSVTELEGSTLAPYTPALSCLNGTDYSFRSSSVVYSGDAHGNGDLRDLATKFRSLVERGPALSGLLFVMNPEEELTIDQTFKGHLAIIVHGDAVVTRAAVEDPTKDSLVIACFGRLAIEGEVAGSVIAGGTVTMEQEAAITGSMVCLAPDYRAIPPDKVFAGTVTRNEKLIAGPAQSDGTMATVKEDHLYIALGPTPVRVETERR